MLQAHEWTQHAYCVGSGLLRVVVPGSGSEVTTDFNRRNDFFMGPTFTDGPYQASATLIAALPSAVYFIPLPALIGLCRKYPSVTRGLLEIMLVRTATLRKQISRISSSSSERLVSRTLHELTQLAPVGAGGYDKRITQSVIASYAGLSREQVNKTMRDLELRGLVHKDEEGGVQVPPAFASSDFNMPTDIHTAPPEVTPEQAALDSFSDLLDGIQKDPDAT